MEPIKGEFRLEKPWKNSIIEIKYETVSGVLLVDEFSETGLVWKEDRNNHIKSGDSAGTKSKTGHWLVHLKTGAFKNHRVIVSLILKQDVLPNMSVWHIDGNKFNNKIENLGYKIINNDTQVCVVCGALKDKSNFKINPRASTGISTCCIDCKNKNDDLKKLHINFSDFVEYNEDSTTRLSWKDDVISPLDCRIKRKRGSEAGSLPRRTVKLNGCEYHLDHVILKLHGFVLGDDQTIEFIDNDKNNLSINNLKIVDLKKVAKKLRGEKYCEKVAHNAVYKVEKRMLRSAKERSKKFGHEIDITYFDIVIPEICPILKIPLFQGVGAVCANSPSLDRKDPKKGYTKDNVWVISYKANTMKTDSGRELLLKFAEWIYYEYD